MIELIIVITIILLLAVILWIFFKGRLYRQIFSPQHYIEFTTSLIKIIAIARHQIDEPPSLLDDPRGLLTSAQIVLFYTIETTQENQYEHHFSLSIADRYTPHAVGSLLTTYVIQLLDVKFNQCQVSISPNRIYHLIFILNPNEQAKFNEQSIEIPTLKQAKERHRQCLKQRHQLQYTPFWPV